MKAKPGEINPLVIVLAGVLTASLTLQHGTVNAQQNGEVMVPNYSRSLPASSRTTMNEHSSSSQHEQGPGRRTNEYLDALTSPTAHTDQSRRIQYIDVNGQPVLVQFTYVGPPKILPIATADSYPEGSTINLICTVSGGQRKGLTLSWVKDGEDLNEDMMRYSGDNLSVEKTGADISILRITNATHPNSGKYTCNAKNPLGEDSTSVDIVINVELKWTKLPSDLEIGLNQDLSVDCDAVGQPQPQITWVKHPSAVNGRNESGKSLVVSQGKQLKLNKAQHKDSGLYECVARNGVDQDLRRIIQIRVRGK